MTRRVTAAGTCLLLAALLSTGIDSAHALRLESMAARAGPVQDVNDTAAAYAFLLAPAAVPPILSWLGRDLRYDLTLGTAGEGLAGDDGLAYVHFGPTWRYRPDALWPGGYLEIGTAVTRLSASRIGDRELGGRWHFTSHVTLGHRFGAARHWHAALRIQHTSNAGTRSPNPGLNIPMLELGYHF